MKKQFDIKAGVRGGIAALIPTFVSLSTLIVCLGTQASLQPWVAVLLACGVSFILGMVCFGWKKASEKDKNPAD